MLNEADIEKTLRLGEDSVTEFKQVRVADRVLTAFPQTLPKAQWSGNPVRQRRHPR